LGVDAAMIRALAMIAALLPSAASAQEKDAYVASNLLAIFYHEFGHALIDIMDLPIFGQEEDAADVLSVLMVNDFFDEEAAVQIIYDTADSFLSDAEQTEEVAYWDTHGPDLQRYYTTICLFIGGNFDEREDIATDFGLPEERLSSCEEEFELANGSWGPVLDDLIVEGGGETLVFAGSGADDPMANLTFEVIRDEVESLNKEFALPQDIKVKIEPCDEPNAFYDPSEKSITMCTEFAGYLAENAPSN
jgi:hypothetical protein